MSVKVALPLLIVGLLLMFGYSNCQRPTAVTDGTDVAVDLEDPIVEGTDTGNPTDGGDFADRLVNALCERALSCGITSSEDTCRTNLMPDKDLPAALGQAHKNWTTQQLIDAETHFRIVANHSNADSCIQRASALACPVSVEEFISHLSASPDCSRFFNQGSSI